MAIKNMILKKKIAGIVYDMYAKSSAELIDYGTSSNVATEIAKLISDLENVTKDEGIIDAKVKAESDALYNKIMGITDEDSTTVSEAYDTLKEVANYIAEHGDLVTGFTTDIQALTTAIGIVGTAEEPGYGILKDLADLTGRVDTLETDVTGLKSTVGDANGGIVKAIADINTTIGAAGDGTEENPGSGMMAQIAKNAEDIDNLQKGSATVTKSDNNGYINVNGDDVLVYDDKEIAAEKIVQDTTHRFVTDEEKTAWNNNGTISVGTEVPETIGDNDLFMLLINEETITE